MQSAPPTSWRTWRVGDVSQLERPAPTRLPPPTWRGPQSWTHFRNDGNGVFTDATATLGVNFEHSLSFTASYADVDGDGWDDLLLVGATHARLVFIAISTANALSMSPTAPGGNG